MAAINALGTACSCQHTHHVARPSCSAENGAVVAADNTHSADSVALGVTDMRATHQVAFNTAQAALWSVDAAARAASQGTFGVGGALLGPHRELLAISCNRVVADGKVADPTAHGERQLVDWYFEKAHQGEQLPSPDQCTIVSSLDPCMMCAGSILTGGFQVVSTTLDTTAGVNCHTDAQYSTLPTELRDEAQHQFSYFGVEGKRPYQGPAAYGESLELPSEVEKRSLDVFLNSLDKVRDTIHSNQGATADLKECQDPQVLATLRKYSPQAMSLRFADGKPGAGLAQPLLAAAREAESRGAASNAAALIDPHGNLVLLTTGKEEQSPVRTAFMELTRTWAKIRAEAGPEADKYLAHLKDCTVVTLRGPGTDSASVMELGAYGSTVEGPLPERAQAGWQYVLPRQTQADIDQEIASLPPLYSQIIHPRIQQVSDLELVDLCQG